jgi:phosphatidylglycerophosphate synthase
MVTDMRATATRSPSTSRFSRSGRDLAVGALLVVVVAAASCLFLGLSTSHIAHAAVLYALMALLLLRQMPTTQPGPGIGVANRVTLARATLVLPVAVLTLQPGALALERAYWWIIVLGAVSMVLDRTDGRVARRTGTTSAFGARFDMELDAFLLLALSVLVWQSGKVGAWVTLIGALRYLFVVGGLFWSVLTGELPSSERRKIFCAVEGVALLVCLGPIVPATLAGMVAAGALAALVYSFAADVRWLASHPDTVR